LKERMFDFRWWMLAKAGSRAPISRHLTDGVRHP